MEDAAEVSTLSEHSRLNVSHTKHDLEDIRSRTPANFFFFSVMLMQDYSHRKFRQYPGVLHLRMLTMEERLI